jgi:ferredoxin
MNITIDQSRCTGCGECVKDCPVGVLKTENHVACVVKPENCIKCQHCLAVCPGMAVIFNGIKAEDCFPAGPLPEPEKVINLLRMRRSIRRFSEKEVPPEILQELLSQLKYSPTGCNDHRLRFSVAGKKEISEFRKITDRYMRFMIKSGLMSLLVPRYKRYFDDILKGEDVIYRNAPHLILVMSPKKAPCAKSDPVIALTQFDLLAQSCGVGTCWCGFAERAFKVIPVLRRMIDCPKNYYVGAAMLFGTPAVKYQRASKPDEFDIITGIRP